jgi:hypothetical protein
VWSTAPETPSVAHKVFPEEFSRDKERFGQIGDAPEGVVKVLDLPVRRPVCHIEGPAPGWGPVLQAVQETQVTVGLVAYGLSR